MQYQCIIVDDDQLSINLLSKYITSVPILSLQGTCSTSLEAYDLILRKKIDLVFLDVQLPELSGLDLARALQYPPKIIFTTAHKDFAVEAFDLDAVDYLLKPIAFERFLRAVNRLQTNNRAWTESPELKEDFLYFRSSRKMVKVVLDNILYVECLKDHVMIYRMGDSELKIKQTLNHLETMLPKKNFLRIHRSFIVAKPKVTAFSKDFIEIGKKEIPVGRKFKDVVNSLIS